MLTNKDLYAVEKEIAWLEDKLLFERLKEIKIHDGQPAIMAYIYLHDGCNQYEIAKHLGLSRASIGISIKRLVKSGYVIVNASELDKRATTLHLSDEGTKTLVKSDIVLDTYISEKYKGLTQTELQRYLDTNKRIRKNLKKMFTTK